MSNVSGEYDVAIGARTSAKYDSSIAIGDKSAAESTASIAIGASTKSTHNSSIAIGHNSNANGSLSVAIGASSNINDNTASESIAIGYRAKTLKARSIALGPSAEINYSDAAVIRMGYAGLTSSLKYALNLYFWSASSELAVNTDSEPGIGYTLNNSNKIILSGCKKLSELLTDTFTLPS